MNLLENSGWLEDRENGLQKRMTLDDFGGYNCSGTLNNRSKSELFRIAVQGTYIR